MEATRSDVFALKKSGLEPFLYADVGAEANGSTLTILSVLARLGNDPWAEAARLTALPKAAVIDSLAQSIAQMPLAPAALAGARDSAVRLVQLLPTNTQSLAKVSADLSETGPPNWVLITVLFFFLGVGMVLNVFVVPKPPSAAPAAIDQSMATPGTIHPAMVSLTKKVAVAALPVLPNGQ